MDQERQLVSVSTAARRLGISVRTFRQRRISWRITEFSNSSDTREKLVDWHAVERAAKERIVPTNSTR